MNEQQAFEVLRASEKYQILTRLGQVAQYQEGQPLTSRLVMVLDTETTGLDTDSDKIIELGFVVCRYNAETGSLHDVVYRYDGFEDPGEPISDVVRDLTGIDDAMVHGQKLDDALVNAWLEKADLVVAHNAGFDRKMVERRFPKAESCHWTCSFRGIDWQSEGIASAKLDYLAYRFGFFFAGHRAVNDAEATLHLLSMTLPKSGTLVFQSLLASTRKKHVRLLVGGKLYDKKDMLKERKYQWAAKERVWHKLVEEADQDTELDWLGDKIYVSVKPEVTVVPLTPLDMYSVREMS